MISLHKYYEALIPDMIPIQYRYGDTEIFLKFPIRYGLDKLLKINSISAQHINITKNDNKQTFTLMKMIKTSDNYIYFFAQI